MILVSLLLTTTCLGLKTNPPPSSSSSSSQQSTDIHRHTSNQQHPQNKNEIEKYSSLPHTIFSSNGRLYNIEKASLQSSNNDDDDIHVSSRSLVFAIKFGNSDSILVLSTCPRSPYLFHNDDDDNDKDGNNNNDNDETITNEQSKTSLWNYNVYNNNNNNHNKRIIPSYPISILTPKLLIGTGGGTSIDSIVLHDKVLEIFLSLAQIKDGMNSTHRIQGIVKSSLLARKVADSLQVFTQDVSSGYGRILSVRSVLFFFVFVFLLVYVFGFHIILYIDYTHLINNIIIMIIEFSTRHWNR